MKVISGTTEAALCLCLAGRASAACRRGTGTYSGQQHSCQAGRAGQGSGRCGEGQLQQVPARAQEACCRSCACACCSSRASQCSKQASCSASLHTGFLLASCADSTSPCCEVARIACEPLDQSVNPEYLTLLMHMTWAYDACGKQSGPAGQLTIVYCRQPRAALQQPAGLPMHPNPPASSQMHLQLASQPLRPSRLKEHTQPSRPLQRARCSLLTITPCAILLVGHGLSYKCCACNEEKLVRKH